jgi:hypothetical protein
MKRKQKNAQIVWVKGARRVVIMFNKPMAFCRWFIKQLPYGGKYNGGKTIAEYVE